MRDVLTLLAELYHCRPLWATWEGSGVGVTQSLCPTSSAHRPGKSAGSPRPICFANAHLGFYSDYWYLSPCMISDGLGAMHSLFWGSVIWSLKWGWECVVGLDRGLAAEVASFRAPRSRGVRPAEGAGTKTGRWTHPAGSRQVKQRAGSQPACHPPGRTQSYRVDMTVSDDSSIDRGTSPAM